jgi:serine/threonine protein kinase/tetratricopeptide (TPR) repeat protein
MKCPKCSAETPGAPRFCGECGTSFAGPPPPGPSDADVTQTQLIPSVELKSGDIFAGRYLVIEELGAGGMGRVYRVLDRTVGEEIALKLLKYDLACDRRALDRFREEVKSARQVNHRNVARVHDLSEFDGVPYITMQYVRGENLRGLINQIGRLDAEQAIRIAGQVCQGLAEAHRQKVVHRDLKPQNIMIDGAGQARIMDFGLARLMTSIERGEPTAREGTPAYISPEQIEGRPVDRRSDIYSLGIVLYEMLTGRPPFRADTREALIMKHLREAPQDPRHENPNIPPGLCRAILKCLEKDPDLRFQSAEEIMAELGRLEQELTTGPIPGPSPEPPEPTGNTWGLLARAAAVLAGVAAVAYIVAVIIGIIPAPWVSYRPSIAVLLDGRVEGSLTAHSLGLQENIVNKLSSTRLHIVPWEIVKDYVFTTQTTKQAGADLEAKHLLLLNLRPIDGSFRITANLVDAKRGDIVQPYIRDLTEKDYFDLEDWLAREIARALKVDLDEQRWSALKKREPKNLEAYNHYLNGMAALRDKFEEAVRHFRAAIEVDPGYALAYWGLGNACEGLLETTDEAGREEVRGRMFTAYAQAYDLNPNAPETNLGMGWAHFYEADNLKAAERFRAALRLDSGNIMANLDTGAFLRSLGLYDRAFAHLKRAHRFNRLDPQPVIQMAQCQSFMGRYERALRLLKDIVPKAPGDRFVLNSYGLNLVMTGRFEEAEVVIEGIAKFDPQGKRPVILSALLAAARGEREKAVELLGKADWFTLEVTAAYLFLGMKDEAIRKIQDGIERGFTERRMYLYGYRCLASNPIFKSLRGDPRFEDILKKQREYYRRELKQLETL